MYEKIIPRSYLNQSKRITLLYLPQLVKLTYIYILYTICPRGSDPFYIVSYNIKWVNTSWTCSMINIEHQKDINYFLSGLIFEQFYCLKMFPWEVLLDRSDFEVTWIFSHICKNKNEILKRAEQKENIVLSDIELLLCGQITKKESRGGKILLFSIFFHTY